MLAQTAMTRSRDMPPGVRGTKVIWMIEQAPPPKPLCFDSVRQWQDYLMLLHTEGHSVIRREDRIHEGRRVVTSVFDRIDYCADCAGGAFRARMSRENRCILPAPQAANQGAPRMLARLANALQQLRAATSSGQISMLAGASGGMAIIVAWEMDDAQHEVTMRYTADECARATDQQIAESIETLIASAWAQISTSRGESLTVEGALQRLRRARTEAPDQQLIRLDA